MPPLLHTSAVKDLKIALMRLLTGRHEELNSLVSYTQQNPTLAYID
jgi:hypothetical protein